LDIEDAITVVLVTSWSLWWWWYQDALLESYELSLDIEESASLYASKIIIHSSFHSFFDGDYSIIRMRWWWWYEDATSESYELSSDIEDEVEIC